MRFKLIILTLLVIIVTASCSKDRVKEITEVSDFPISMRLTGTKISFDSISGIPGSVSIIGDNLLFFQYESDNLIMVTDSSFRPIEYIFPKGQGPNEMLAVSGAFGDIVSDGSIAAFDPFSCKIVEYHQSDSIKYTTHKFDEKLRDYSPRCAIRLQSGNYISIKGLNQFGIVSFDSDGQNIHEWPVGLNSINESAVKINHIITSVRDLAYNKLNRTIGEIYGVLPYIIIHNEDGSIDRIISIGIEPYMATIDEDTPKILNSLRMTDNNIYALCNNTDDETMSKLLIMDYNGNSVAQFDIDSASSFCIDTKNRRIVAVDPNAESPVIVYNLPNEIHNP